MHSILFFGSNATNRTLQPVILTSKCRLSHRCDHFEVITALNQRSSTHSTQASILTPVYSKSRPVQTLLQHSQTHTIYSIRFTQRIQAKQTVTSPTLYPYLIEYQVLYHAIPQILLFTTYANLYKIVSLLHV